MVDRLGMFMVDSADESLNSYLPSLLLLPASVHAVLTDVVKEDLRKGRQQRKVFLSGA